MLQVFSNEQVIKNRINNEQEHVALGFTHNDVVCIKWGLNSVCRMEGEEHYNPSL